LWRPSQMVQGEEWSLPLTDKWQKPLGDLKPNFKWTSQCQIKIVKSRWECLERVPIVERVQPDGRILSAAARAIESSSRSSSILEARAPSKSRAEGNSVDHAG
jgi:hypothetical protein